MTNPNIKTILDQYQKSKIREQTKIREILQQTALLGLERSDFFKKAAFYGGSALRILYGLDRFSEDLDFTLLKPEKNFDFMPYLEGLKRELFSFGFTLEISKKPKNFETSLLSAFMKINTLQLYLSIGSEIKNIARNEKIQIKLEIDTDPPAHFRIENHLVMNPVNFYILTLHKSDLFAGKMHAILYRTWKGRIKGRDWYDLVWYIQNKIPLNITCFQEYLKKSENFNHTVFLNRTQLLEMLQMKIETIDWETAKADVIAFVTNPHILDIWSKQFFSDLIQNLQIEGQK